MPRWKAFAQLGFAFILLLVGSYQMVNGLHGGLFLDVFPAWVSIVLGVLVFHRGWELTSDAWRAL